MSSRDINKLQEPFRTGIKTLLDKANKAGIPAFVTDTTRTVDEQRVLVARGYSKTMNSKHLTGEAADIAFKLEGKLSYASSLYEELYKLSKDIPYIIWPYRDLGWDWDKPHYQHDKTKKIGDNTDMDDKEKAEYEKLLKKERTETAKVTAERDKALQKARLYEQEVSAHKETIERYDAEKKKREDAEAELRECRTEKLNEVTVLAFLKTKLGL